MNGAVNWNTRAYISLTKYNTTEGVDMSRRRRVQFVPKSVRKMEAIIVLLLERHPAGFTVLSGRSPWPDLDELAEMLSFCPSDNIDICVKGGATIPFAQRRVEGLDRARELYNFLEKYGGAKAVADVVAEYRRARPRAFNLLARVGNAGLPGAKSLEDVAFDCAIDVKTLRAQKARAVREIAVGIVYRNEPM